MTGRWRPELPDGRPTYAVRYHAAHSARRLLHVDPREARPVVEVSDGDRDYDAVVDLLGSGPDAAEFVVESEEDGTAVLRFVTAPTAVDRTRTSLHGHLPARSRLDRQRRPRVRCKAASHRCRIRLGPQPASLPPAAPTPSPSTRYARMPACLPGAGARRHRGRLRHFVADRVPTCSVLPAGEVDRQLVHRLRHGRPDRWPASRPGFAADVRTFLDGYRMAGVAGGVATSAGRTRTSSSRSAPGRTGSTPTSSETCSTWCPPGCCRTAVGALPPRPLHVRHTGLPEPTVRRRARGAGRRHRARDEVPPLRRVRQESSPPGSCGSMTFEIAQLANDPDVPERGVLHVSVGWAMSLAAPLASPRCADGSAPRQASPRRWRRISPPACARALHEPTRRRPGDRARGRLGRGARRPDVLQRTTRQRGLSAHCHRPALTC